MNTPCHLKWWSTAGAEKRSKRRAGTVGEQPSPNKKTNQRENTEDVLTDSLDLCNAFNISHCLYVRAAGGGRGTNERKRGYASAFKAGLRKEWKAKEKAAGSR